MCPSERFDSSLPGKVVPHAYLFNAGALFINVSSEYETKRRRSVTVLIAVDGQPFEACVAGRQQLANIVVLKPLTVGRFTSYPGDLACFIVGPEHRFFRTLNGISAPGVLTLPCEWSAPFVSDLQVARRDGISLSRAQYLFEDVVASVAEQLPVPKPLDRHVHNAIVYLQHYGHCSLRELARAVHISYHRLSHLFAQNIGLTLRSYQVWRRIHKALALLAGGCSQTVVAQRLGFTDTSHLHRVCFEEYGLPPSFFSATRCVAAIPEDCSF